MKKLQRGICQSVGPKNYIIITRSRSHRNYSLLLGSKGNFHFFYFSLPFLIAHTQLLCTLQSALAKIALYIDRQAGSFPSGFLSQFPRVFPHNFPYIHVFLTYYCYDCFFSFCPPFFKAYVTHAKS